MLRGLTIALIVVPAIASAGWPSSSDCAVVTKAQAALAVSYLERGAPYVEACETCEEPAAHMLRPGVVATAAAAQVGERGWGLVLNGKPVDLAHVFARMPDGRFMRVGAVTGCFASTGAFAFLNVPLPGSPHGASACSGAPVVSPWLDIDGFAVSVPASFDFEDWNPSTDSFGQYRGLRGSWTATHEGAPLSLQCWHDKDANAAARADAGVFGPMERVKRGDSTVFRRVMRLRGEEVRLELTVPTKHLEACKGLVEAVLGPPPAGR